MKSYGKNGFSQYYSKRVDVKFGANEEKLATHLLKNLSSYLQEEPRKILDVGCSHGGWGLLFKDFLKAREAYGIDISKKAIEIANDKGLRAFELNLNNEPFPFKENFFDIVFMMETIEHLVNPDNVLQEIHRVLAPSGILIITTPNLASFVNRFVLLGGYQPYFTETSFKYAEGYFLGGRLSYNLTGHLRLYTLKGLRGLLSNHGFEVIHGFNFPLIGWSVPKLVLLLDNVLGRHFPSLAISIALYARKSGGIVNKKTDR